MKDTMADTVLLDLLNQALARELHVSVQYMLQHAVEAGKTSLNEGKKAASRQSKFIGSHALYFLPVSALKRIAITEMRHAEAISERIVFLGGKPVTDIGDIILGKTPEAMLQIDKQEEQEAIELYGEIIEASRIEDDDITAKMFQQILSDEEKHFQEFSKYLEDN